jgi:hypothetical protein
MEKCGLLYLFQAEFQATSLNAKISSPLFKEKAQASIQQTMKTWSKTLNQAQV